MYVCFFCLGVCFISELPLCISILPCFCWRLLPDLQPPTRLFWGAIVACLRMIAAPGGAVGSVNAAPHPAECVCWVGWVGVGVSGGESGVMMKCVY